MAQPQADVVYQLLPSLGTIQQILQQIDQQITPGPIPTLAPPAVERVPKELAEGITQKDNNL